MKNALLKSFLGIFIVANIIFFDDIMSVFYIFSEIFSVAMPTNIDIVAIILLVAFVVVFIVFLIHYFLKRDKNEVANTIGFKPPRNMTPTEVGYLVDGIVDDKDISALLVYWASKGYIEIKKDGKEQKLTKLVEKLPDECKKFEHNFFSLVFGKENETTTSKIVKKLNEDGSSRIDNIVSGVKASVGDKYFNQKTIWLRQVYVCIFAVLFYFSMMYFRIEHYIDIVPVVEIYACAATSLLVISADWVLAYYDYRHKNNATKGRLASVIVFLSLVGTIFGLNFYFFRYDLFLAIILCVMISIIAVVFLLNRKIGIYTAEGAVCLGEILGFKEFISTAENDRIKMLVEQDPNAFYEILPYATVLGVSDKWIKNFDVIKKSNKIDEEGIEKFAALSLLISSRTLSFVTAAKLARTAQIASIAGGVVLGKGGKGSNFGGYRRK